MNIKQLKETADNLFTKRSSYVTLLQEIAENFYPERADFTIRREHGNEFSGNLMSSYPVITRRDLGDQIGVMLRPTDKEWFKLTTTDPDLENNENNRWLERATKIQRQAMYDRRTLFTRATKEADHDFAAFGQAVISCRLNKDMDGLLYRNWHLRDVVWQENDEGKIGAVFRKWKPTNRDLMTMFGANVHPNVSKEASKKPFGTVNCLHMVVEADLYNENPNGMPYWSLVYDCDNYQLMEAVAVKTMEYVIPRWQTVSGSQYAYSPATITALPDARLIQAMTYTILEAGEKAVSPPMLATQDAVRSDVSIYAGGITWVDMEYDERLGAALRPLNQDLRGLPFGQDMITDSQAMIATAFYLNKLTLPERAPEMTAYEVGQRVQEYIRGALPIFEPMEMEYNGGICELTFEVLLNAGAFGSPRDIPASLQDADVTFKFESPLHDAIEQQKGQKFLEGKALIAEALDLDQQSVYLMDVNAALRDSLEGIGVPANWVNDQSTVEQHMQERQDEVNQEAELAKMQQGADVAATIGQAQKAMAE